LAAPYSPAIESGCKEQSIIVFGSKKLMDGELRPAFIGIIRSNPKRVKSYLPERVMS
jgi:hypothetical protein